MKISIVIFALGLYFFTPQQVTLEDLRWQKRVILFFPASDDFILEVSDSLKVEIGIRDITYFVLTDTLQTNGNYRLDPIYVESLKAKYLLGARTACWALLGKDGGMKLRQEEELDWQVALQTVDGWALRGELVSW